MHTRLQGTARREGSDSVASIAHDARNMMTALSVFSELLTEPGVLADPYRHYAEELRVLATAAVGLMEQLLSPESGTAKLCACEASQQTWEVPAEETCDPAVEVLGAQSAFRRLAGAAVRLELDLASEVGRTPLSPRDCTRVLMNLVTNAAEAMPGGGRIRIAVQRAGLRRMGDRRGQAVMISVTDSGAGIAEPLRRRIFDTGFSSGKPGLHKGVGLSTVADLVEGAGGSIRCTGKAGEGATFEILLPLLSKLRTPHPLITDSIRESCLQC